MCVLLMQQTNPGRFISGYRGQFYRHQRLLRFFSMHESRDPHLSARMLNYGFLRTPDILQDMLQDVRERG